MHTKLHSLPGCHTSVPASFLKATAFAILPPPQRGVENQPRETETKKQQSWLNSQEQQCQTWLASSTSKYILPLLMPPFSYPKFFTPLFRSPCAGLFATIPLQHTPSSAGQKLSPFLDLLRAPGIAEQSIYRPSPQPKLPDTVLLRALK